MLCFYCNSFDGNGYFRINTFNESYQINFYFSIFADKQSNLRNSIELMQNSADKNYLYIMTVCVTSIIIYLAFEFFLTNGKMGVPLDDTWIHFQFADNFSRGHFFEFNQGEPVAGTTSPLYVVVLALVSFILHNFIVNSIFLSALFYILSCIFIYKLSLIVFDKNNFPFNDFDIHIAPELVSLLVALLTAVTGRFVWSAMSGMETTMFTFFCIAGIYLHLKNLEGKKITLMPALMFSLATVSRPEGFLLFGLYMADLILNFKKNHFQKNFFKNVILASVIFLAITIPYFLFSYSVSGSFLPNTFRGQGGGINFIPDLKYVMATIITLLEDNFVTGILYSVCFYYYIKNIRKNFEELRYVNLVFIWIFLLPLVSSILIPNYRHHLRYQIPLIPFINLASVYVLLILFFSYNKKRAGSKLFLTGKKIFYAVLLISGISFFIYAIEIGKNTDNINNQQLKIAEWVGKNVDRNETLALNDIGAITFINKNRIIDMAGLVTPEFLRYRTYSWKDNLDSMNYLLKKNNVNYIIIYDDWFKEFLELNKKSLEFLTSAYLEENTICGGKEMKVYKINYNSF